MKGTVESASWTSTRIGPWNKYEEERSHKSLEAKQLPLNPHAVFGAVERLIFAGVAVALIRSAFGETLLAEFVAEVERAGNYSESDAGPHERQKWAPDAGIHASFVLLYRLRGCRLYDFEPSRVHHGHHS